MRHTRFSSVIAVLFCFSTFAAVGAYAGQTQTWVLTGSNGTAPPCSTALPCARVTLGINSTGTAATFTVTSLDNNYIFDSFGFNAQNGGSTLSLSLGTSSGEVNGATLGGPGNEDGWGKFNYNFRTGENGGSAGGACTVTGGSASAGCTFSFTVDGTGLTLADFEHTSSGGTGSGFFAGHAAAPSGGTGYEGKPQPVSEPSSLGMLFSGFLAIGSFGRRFLKN